MAELSYLNTETNRLDKNTESSNTLFIRNKVIKVKNRKMDKKMSGDNKQKKA